MVRGGKALLRKRANLAAAGLTGAQWRGQRESARLFLTADGEKGKSLGNETIRWHPDEGWLDVRLPGPLAHLANRPHGRYRLSCPVAFTYRGDEVAAQTATGAVRYDITCDPARDRWYVDASWKTLPAPAAPLDELRRQARWWRSTSTPGTSPSRWSRPTATSSALPPRSAWTWPGCLPSIRDGRLRAAISSLIATAKQYGARAIVIEDLDFAEARSEGRERHGNRPSRGQRGRAFRRLVGRHPDREAPRPAGADGHQRGAARDRR